MRSGPGARFITGRGGFMSSDADVASITRRDGRLRRRARALRQRREPVRARDFWSEVGEE